MATARDGQKHVQFIIERPGHDGECSIAHSIKYCK